MDNQFSQLTKPVFMPDATYGVVNSISFEDLKNTDTNFIVTNTLHMFLNYISVFENPKSYKELTHYNGGLLTDSGGFQAYSFVKKGLGKVVEDGIHFISPKNNSKHFLTPEKSIEIQLALRSDAIVVLDDPIDPQVNLERKSLSIERTLRWAKICKNHFSILVKKINDSGEIYIPKIFCVIQGGDDFALREKCFLGLKEIGFDGYGFGGWPLDENGVFYDELAKFNAELVNTIKDKNVFNYAMGVGTPDDIIKCIGWGYNLFDCVLPSRNARHGYLYVGKGNGESKGENFDILRITGSKYTNDYSSINSQSNIAEVKNTSKAFLRYLFKIGDSNAFRIATLNNIEFYNNTILNIENNV